MFIIVRGGLPTNLSYSPLRADKPLSYNCYSTKNGKRYSHNENGPFYYYRYKDGYYTNYWLNNEVVGWEYLSGKNYFSDNKYFKQHNIPSKPFGDEVWPKGLAIENEFKLLF